MRSRVRLHLGKVNAAPAKRGNEVAGVKVLIPFRVARDRGAERLPDFVLEHGSLWSILVAHKVVLSERRINIGSGYQFMSFP